MKLLFLYRLYNQVNAWDSIMVRYIILVKVCYVLIQQMIYGLAHL